jgi:hypothetical protein
MGFEICEQLGWRIPQHTVVPMASGSLLTKIHKAYKEFSQLGIVSDTKFKIHGTQATGCAPISHALKKGTDIVKPVPKPDTIVKSLAIGTPADGYYAIHSMRQTGGSAEDVTDDEVVEGIRMLAEYAGIFAETAGGVTVAGAKKLIQSGHLGADDAEFTERAKRIAQPIRTVLASFGLDEKQVAIAHRVFSATVRGLIEPGTPLGRADDDIALQATVTLFVTALESGNWPTVEKAHR